jgi:hypothetical protein
VPTKGTEGADQSGATKGAFGAKHKQNKGVFIFFIL